jgi:hypothetical protein
MERILVGAGLVGSLICGSALFAQEIANPQAPAELKPVDMAPPISPQPRILSMNCYTSQPNCAGVAWFYGFDQRGISCSLYFSNGSQSDFVLREGQDHGVHVQYGDLQACVWGTSGVPGGTTRYWIYVK